MTEPSPDIETLFSDIASVTPSPEATAKALARAKAVVAADKPRRRWLWPASIAAALLVAAGLTLPFILPRQASAQDALAATFKATAAYKGWVHMKRPDGKPRAGWNMVNSDRTVYRSSGPEDIQFFKHQAGEVSFYSAENRTIFLHSVNPIQGRRVQDTVTSMPWNLKDLITRIAATVGDTNVHVKETTEHGMNRFEIEFPFYAVQRLRNELLAANWPMLPHIVWVDPKTGLISRIGEDTWENGWTFSYGEPELKDVFDAGAPRDTKVVDTRATREALAAYERVMNPITRDYPDGVLLLIGQGGNDLQRPASSLTVSFRSGKQWAIRYYAATTLGPAEEGKVQWIDDPKDGSAILARMAHVLPREERGGDGQRGWFRRYDPKTGAISHNGTIVSQDGKSFTTETRPGEGVLDPDSARVTLDISPIFHLSYFAPTVGAHAFSPASRLELISSPDRPGLAALRLQWVYFDNMRVMSDSVDWFDPAHQDRLVESITTSFTSDPTPAIRQRIVTQYGDYGTLPDGRTYPTTMRTRRYAPDAQGQLMLAEPPEPTQPSLPALDERSPGKSTIRFFPGAKLPEFPAPSAPPLPTSPAPTSAPAPLRKP